ncbi:unnamed protein product [Caenorhabditis bovis]|uniref:EGF-like domain-containing protein n=1 Tax=Caenorhabditis bovis TaxID=2654633 RepID=A0A8S1EN98_9PELO|nr:unnamed protein product [Caenorhabditis bovis]
MLTIFLYFVFFPSFATPQFLSYDAVRMRVPGRCSLGDYDCGLGQCVSIEQFRDGKPDCLDGSDEWCFIGQVSCGPVYCADYKDALPCVVYPKCDGTSKELPWCSVSKEKLCADKQSFPCKGYGECVLWEWLLDGKNDCIDGSDEDENYVMPLQEAYRCARNKTGIILPKPIPQPPEDHSSLFVPGCSFCPNNIGQPSIVPSTETTTTPKYPFATLIPDKTAPPLENFPFFPVPPPQPTDAAQPDPDDFFPPVVEFTRVTKPKVPITSTPPHVNVEGFFPDNSESPNWPIEEPTTVISAVTDGVRIATLPPANRFVPPLVFPGFTPPPYGQPSTQIPPVSPITVAPIPTETATVPSNGNEKLIEALIPFIPGIHIATTSKPMVFTIPSIFTKPPSNQGSETPSNPKSTFIYGGWGTSQPSEGSHNYGNQDGNTRGVHENGEHVISPGTRRPFEFGNQGNTYSTPDYWSKGSQSSSKGSQESGAPSSSQAGEFPGFQILPTGSQGSHEYGDGTNGPPTATSQGSQGYHGNKEVQERPSSWKGPDEIESSSTPEESGSPEIYEGWFEEKTPKPTIPSEHQLPETSPTLEETTANIVTTRERTTDKPGVTKVIHIGPDGRPDVPEKSLEEHHGGGIIPIPGFESGIGFVRTSTSQTTVTSSTKRQETTSGGMESTSDAVTPSRMSLTTPKVDESCLNVLKENQSLNDVECKCDNGMFPNESGNCEVLVLPCRNCDYEDITKMLKQRSVGDVNITTNALGVDLCFESAYYPCHVYADCKSDGFRYTCTCKKGTIDVSDGHGRLCEGFPEESDCVMVLGICLIVWLLFLLGVFTLTILLCLLFYYLCRSKCCRRIIIHPANSEGLQRVVIGRSSKQSEENVSVVNDGKMPHMRSIFAESLRHSAKGSKSAAIALAVADFKKKRVSKAPEMTQVIEESPTESNKSILDPPIPETPSLPKVSSLAKLSTNTSTSEPATPVAVVDTPILEKNSSAVSLVSANDNAPQLPSLPLPLPVPITTGPPSAEDEKEIGYQIENELERPTSSHSIGVQPTIWETYRVLGAQYSKADSATRKKSVDSLELLFEARLAETARTQHTLNTGKQSERSDAAVTFNVPKSHHGNDQSDAKIASMIGVTNFTSPRSNAIRSETSESSPPPVQEETEQKTSNEETPILQKSLPSAEKSLEAALLIEMAKQGIELPLSPKHDEKNEIEFPRTSVETSRPKIIDPDDRPIRSRQASAKSLERPSRIPSAVRRRKSDGDELFVPTGSRHSRTSVARKPAIQRLASETTDESDPEVAFFKKLDTMKFKRQPYPSSSRKIMRRRRPERTLSSISEKSAEIAADASLEHLADTSISCPATTRAYLEAQPVPLRRRFIFKRKVIEATGQSSDVDVPKVFPESIAQPIVSSPEIPDVTRQKSLENLKMAQRVEREESRDKIRGQANSRGAVKAKPIKTTSSSLASSNIGSVATTPRNGEDASSLTSRSTRNSVISRKIAIRRNELKSVSGSAHELRSSNVNRTGSGGSKLRGARSVGDLSRRRPNWDISSHRDNLKPREFLPPIGRSPRLRTATNSPQPRHRRSDSRFSLVSLPAVHTSSSFWSSPYFQPSQDMRKPPKEDLWWNPTK